MATLILFNKPFGILSQFSGDCASTTLRHFIPIPDVYPAGRLDKDSEGLLLLTDNGDLQHLISHPERKMAKSYWVQVEGLVSDTALQALRSGVTLKDGPTRPAKARSIKEPDLWPRDPPVRFRKQIPTSWLELTISEGRNRQVRRMTAATGFPTLRLIRHQVGCWQLAGLQPGEWTQIDVSVEQLSARGSRSKESGRK
ncbi:MAG: pseudouridine synthase [Gammaproteobacteria bacterium]|nr:pseudouridine synthase [Gammaproteobacteria bacterium]